MKQLSKSTISIFLSNQLSQLFLYINDFLSTFPICYQLSYCFFLSNQLSQLFLYINDFLSTFPICYQLSYCFFIKSTFPIVSIHQRFLINFPKLLSTFLFFFKSYITFPIVSIHQLQKNPPFLLVNSSIFHGRFEAPKTWPSAFRGARAPRWATRFRFPATRRVSKNNLLDQWRSVNYHWS